jgi:hypothetical protein
MGAFRMLIGMLFAIAMTGIASAQTGPRGGIPPGTSQDGSRPSDGAIKGGSIAPDESRGVPNDGSSRPPEVEVNRCRELSGVLREQCLRDLGASTTTRPPAAVPPSPAGRNPAPAQDAR